MGRPLTKLQLAVLGLALIGIFFMLQARWSRTVTVLMDHKEFSPSKLQIQPGTRVVFKNQGQELAWPASNFHPTHTFYPEAGGCIGSKLDACRALKPGESFSFTFGHVGKWPLHDHLHPGLTMIVAVGAEQVRNGNTNAADLEKLPYPELLETITRLSQADPVAAWEDLKTAFFVNGEVRGQVHEFTHIIGNDLYTQYGLAGIQFCTAEFAFGCYHGVTEQALTDLGLPGVLEIQGQCQTFFVGKPAANASCIHGIGHGVLSYTGLDLGPALRDCDLLDMSFRQYCYDGVFMENASNPQSILSSWQFCEALDARYQSSCARYQTLRQFETAGRDFSAVSRFCFEAENRVIRETCADALGILAAQIRVGEYISIDATCRLSGSEEQESLCVIGAVKEVIFQTFPNWQSVSQELCQGLSGQWQTRCFSAREAVKQNYERS